MLRDVTEILKSVQSDANELRIYAQRFDLTRNVYLYTRQSNLNDKFINYREAQAQLCPALLDAGVPKERLVVLNDDDKSATLNERYREDYLRLLEAVDDCDAGTIVCIDISRLHRDPTQKQSTYLAALMEARRVCVLTKHDNKWLWLDMTSDVDRKTYLDLAANAAQERKKFRAISMTARLTGVMKGGANGGGTIPFGWRLVPKMDKRESPDDKPHAPRAAIYAPHALIKLQIMRESLHPHIRTFGDLRNHLIARGLVIPAFDASLPMRTFTRSVLSRVYRKVGGKRVYQGRHEALSEYGDTFLLSALTEPLSIGDVRFGSGQSGYYALRKHQEIAESMKQASDSQITPGRVLVHNDRQLALCRTEENPDFPMYEELTQLYKQVAAKWSPVDMEAARAQQYRVNPDNLARVNRSEKTLGRPYGTANAWAGYVWCGKHGWDAEREWPVLAETLKWAKHKTEKGYEQWFCTDKADKGGGEMCTNWSGDSLRKILDMHLKSRIHRILFLDEAIFRSIFEERKKAKEDCERLRRDVERLETELRRKNEKYNRFDNQLADAPDAERNAVLNAILNDEIKPLMGVLAEKKSNLAEAVKSDLHTDAAQTKTELRRDLTQVYERYETLETVRKRHLIALLVDSIVVLVAEGIEATECVILWKWADGKTDTLIGWRDCVRDNRPWTEEEDAALHRLWGTSCDYTEIKAALLPGRNFWSMRLRAMKIGAGRRGKLRKIPIKVQAMEADKTWHDLNSNVLYLVLTDTDASIRQEEAIRFGLAPVPTLESAGYGCRIVTGDEALDTASAMLGETLPPEVENGVRLTQNRYWRTPKTA